MIDLTWRESLMLGLSRKTTWLMKANSALSRPPEIAHVERDVIYARHGGADLPLDAFLPRGDGPWPVVMMIHGGGFILGDKAQLDTTCRTLCHAGFLVFNINYRLAPEVHRSAQLDDCAAALQWVKNNAAAYGGDPERLCVGGGSAGGYLAASLGVMAQEGSYRLQTEGEGDPLNCTFQAALLLNGVFDLHTSLSSGFPRIEFMARCFLGDGYDDPETARAASPLHQLNEAFPPAFIGVGTRDRLHGESMAMHKALSSHGVSVETREYHDSSHGWFNWSWTENARLAHEHMIAWLHQQLS